MHRFALTLTAILAGAGNVSAQTPATRGSDDQSRVIQERRDVVSNLQKQVDDLKAASNDNWLTEQRAKEIRGLVEDVLADADTRVNLLESGVGAGYDKGFFIGSTDGN